MSNIMALDIRQTDYPTGIRQPASNKLIRRVLVDADTTSFQPVSHELGLLGRQLSIQKKLFFFLVGNLLLRG